MPAARQVAAARGDIANRLRLGGAHGSISLPVVHCGVDLRRVEAWAHVYNQSINVSQRGCL